MGRRGRGSSGPAGPARAGGMPPHPIASPGLGQRGAGAELGTRQASRMARPFDELRSRGGERKLDAPRIRRRPADPARRLRPGNAGA